MKEPMSKKLGRLKVRVEKSWLKSSQGTKMFLIAIPILVIISFIGS